MPPMSLAPMSLAPMAFAPMSFAPMSPLGMFIYAGPVSKLVMALLLAAAVWTWVLIIDRSLFCGVFPRRWIACGPAATLASFGRSPKPRAKRRKLNCPTKSIHQKREQYLRR